ncbi:hypothetical protein XENOCAPTIV_019472 [Xenoophorus captivus]|uniref:Uncharacterized protein n=1 Tax=Xenoophorus captivus TaxID=1517983 RepID=A0ABV0S0A6_9TELE
MIPGGVWTLRTGLSANIVVSNCNMFSSELIEIYRWCFKPHVSANINNQTIRRRNPRSLSAKVKNISPGQGQIKLSVEISEQLENILVSNISAGKKVKREKQFNIY